MKTFAPSRHREERNRIMRFRGEATPRNDKSGFTFVEVVIATLIMGLVVGGLLTVQWFMGKQSIAIKDKTFANQKAIMMIEELRSVVSGAERDNVAVLDDYGDGASYNPVLTTDKTVENPSADLSGNVAYCGGWRYLRQITVLKMPEEPYGRRVFVRVYRAACGDTATPAEELAETMTVLKTVRSEFVPSQIYDVYILALENMPGWWSEMSTLRPMFDMVLQDVQTRNPGLEIRPHWITRLSYGRDPYYTPYINSLLRTDEAAIPYVYLYPGLTRKPDGTDMFFYEPSIIQGRVNVDDTISNDGQYTLCDQANHAVRYPEELAIYNNLVAQAVAAGNEKPEISLRMFLEQLNDSSTPLKNALIINLHGELLPLPPIRNYSDAAKDPETYPDYRIVTHPENIRYNSGTTPKLRVYPYLTNPDTYATTTALDYAGIVLEQIYIPPADISSLIVQKIDGNDTTIYSARSAANPADYEIAYLPTTPAQSTVILLKNTPMRHPLNAGNGGLASTDRLYGLEYIPAPLGASFSRNLADTTDTLAKNTARWIITLPTAYVSNGEHALTTFISSNTAVLLAGTKPANMSRTYFWVGQDPPLTERYQFIGDPRHCPYEDVKTAHRYNWYHNDPNSTDYPSYDKAQNGWDTVKVEVDIPRFYQIYRQGLLNSQAIWSTMNGFSFFYYALGGEFGSDNDPLPNSVPFVITPWSRTGATTVSGVDEILSAHGSATVGSSRVVAKTDNSWYAKYWIGELYPDSAFATWKSTGNLPTGAGNYYRARYTDSTLTNNWNNYDRLRRTAEKGSSSFFNGKSATGAGPFKHQYNDGGDGSITTLGTDLISLFSVPILSTISSPRPWKIDFGSGYPPEWSDTEYSSQRTTLAINYISALERTFYDSDLWGYRSSGAVQMTRANNTAFMIVSGLERQADFGSAQMSKLVLITMLRSFLDAGLYADISHIVQVPKVEITDPSSSYEAPSNVASITVGWNVLWKKWDGSKYTSEYSDSFADTTAELNLFYHMKYSADNGRTWKFCNTDVPTSPGEISNDILHKIAHISTSMTEDWDVPAASFPRGTYILRVEAYRGVSALHYGYDQTQIYINR